MATRLNVINQALVQLGANVLDSDPVAEDATNEIDLEMLVAQTYPNIVRSAQTNTPWEFNAMRAKLAEDENNPPVNIYTRAYPLPADLIVGPDALYISETMEFPISRGWEKTAGRIETDYNEVWIKYRKFVDEADWPDYFERFVAIKLAYEWAYAVTNDLQMKAAIKEEMM